MSAQNKGIIFTVLSAVCFATGGLLIKLNTMSSMSINGLRSFLAFFYLWDIWFIPGTPSVSTGRC